MQIIVLVSDIHLNCLRPFARQWEKYWNRRFIYQNTVNVFGFTPPHWKKYKLPDYFKFTSLGDFADYPAQRWSDAFLKVLNEHAQETFLLLLEDYFLIRDADIEGIYDIYRYMQDNPEIIRFDLTADRAMTGGIQPYGSLSHFDLVQSNITLGYHWSLQAGLFRRDLVKQIIVPNESAWECELRGNERLANHPEFKVLGTRQNPLKYLIAVQGGKVKLDGGYQGEAYKLSDEDRIELEQLGYLENL